MMLEQAPRLRPFVWQPIMLFQVTRRARQHNKVDIMARTRFGAADRNRVLQVEDVSSFHTLKFRVPTGCVVTAIVLGFQLLLNLLGREGAWYGLLASNPIMPMGAIHLSTLLCMAVSPQIGNILLSMGCAVCLMIYLTLLPVLFSIHFPLYLMNPVISLVVDRILLSSGFTLCLFALSAMRLPSIFFTPANVKVDGIGRFPLAASRAEFISREPRFHLSFGKRFLDARHFAGFALRCESICLVPIGKKVDRISRKRLLTPIALFSSTSRINHLFSRMLLGVLRPATCSALRENAVLMPLARGEVSERFRLLANRTSLRVGGKDFKRVSAAIVGAYARLTSAGQPTLDGCIGLEVSATRGQTPQTFRAAFLGYSIHDAFLLRTCPRSRLVTTALEQLYYPNSIPQRRLHLNIRRRV